VTAGSLDSSAARGESGAGGGRAGSVQQPPRADDGDGQSVGWVQEALRAHEEQAELSGAGHVRRGSPQPLPGTVREELVLERIDRARRARPRVKEDRITMSHGAGGKATQTLIEAIFLDGFRNPLLEPLEDAARLLVGGTRLAFTTDSYVVSPLFFPGGDIGDLAVNGTVNDLSMSGAVPICLSAGFILEEGFGVADLGRIVASMAAAAAAAGVQIVTGDTKVVEKGKADGCYINTAGVGLIEHEQALGVAQARPGDAIIVSGPIGDHGVTIMLARGELDIEADVTSDTAPLNGLVAGLLAATSGVRALRDATRGGARRRGRDDTQRDRQGRRRRRHSRRGGHPGPAGGARRLRAARHRPDVRGVRGPDDHRGRRRGVRAGAGRAPRASARRAGRRHRARDGRPAWPRAAQDRVRRHEDRGPAGG